MIDGLDEPQLRVEVLDRSGRVVLDSDWFGEGVAASPLYDGTRLVGALRFVGLAFALAMLLARGIVRPVEELTGVTTQLAGGHYEIRAVRRGDDETGTWPTRSTGCRLR